MSFDDFIENAHREVAGIIGEEITLNSETLLASFDEQTNPWDMTEHGQSDTVTVRVVIPSLSVTTPPEKNQRITRGSQTYLITEVQISTGNYEITAQEL